jgi:hypothetical protein
MIENEEIFRIKIINGGNIVASIENDPVYIHFHIPYRSSMRI